MSAPRVSICLPNFNTRPFLDERVESIFAQGFTDWELIICDSHSTDGAWEFFQQVADRDSRVQLHQVPKEGPYAGWNECLRRARGEYVYIATSDDTMMPDCLEKMVAALDAHPECDLCQSELEVIDEKGAPVTQGWRSVWKQFAPEWGTRAHIRRAPHDGILHFALCTVYTSITQLLIRRSLFERTGLFDTDRGSIADFEWGMRAGLVADVVYLPEVLATWRKHSSQLTQDTSTAANRMEMIQMSARAYERALPHMKRPLPEKVLHELKQLYWRQHLYFGRKERKSKLARLGFMLAEAWRGSLPARAALRGGDYFHGRSNADVLRDALRELAVPGPEEIMPVKSAAVAGVKSR